MVRIVILLFAVLPFVLYSRACPPQARKGEVQQRRLVSTCVPQFDLELKYGGMVIGPAGELTDVSKLCL